MKDEKSFRLCKQFIGYTMKMVPSMEQFTLNNFGKKDESGGTIGGVKQYLRT